MMSTTTAWPPEHWVRVLLAQIALGLIVAWVLPVENRFVTYYHGLTAPALLALLTRTH